jgi:geranylgeranyl pyrophosphate synthase
MEPQPISIEQARVQLKSTSAEALLIAATHELRPRQAIEIVQTITGGTIESARDVIHELISQGLLATNSNVQIELTDAGREALAKLPQTEVEQQLTQLVEVILDKPKEIKALHTQLLVALALEDSEVKN